MSDMTYDCVSAAETWANSAHSELVENGFAQIDIDNLFDDPPEDAATCALTCLVLAVGEIRKTRATTDGMLVIPLPWTETLTLAAPSLTDLLGQTWTYGPGLHVPGLYLMDHSIWRGYEPTETYRRHLESDGHLPGGYSAYYETSRVVGTENPIEYNRDVRIRTID